jgi:thioesterase domain-containing protein
MACTRTNLAHAFAEPPEDLGAVITPLLPRLLRSAPPILLGNCIGARIILALAARLEQAGHPVAQIILIDPPVPGLASRNRAGDAAPPKRVRRFYDVLKHPTTVDEIHVDHVICAESDPQLDLRRQTWEPRLRPGGRIHITPGDHQSCIREHQVRVANLLADILDTPQ